MLIDPVRAMAVLAEDQDLLHPSAAYIYRKQLEEADRIIVNKSDLLDYDVRQRLRAMIEEQFPGREIAFVSCKNGEGLDRWLADVMNDDECGNWILDVNYDTYAEGEAVLGWLNARFGLAAERDTDWSDFSRRYLETMQRQLRSAGARIGHIKLFLSAGDASLTANLTSIDGPVLVHEGNTSAKAGQADMTLNARVQMSPEQLQRMSLDILRESFAGISVETHGIRSLRPGRPKPTFRYAQKVRRTSSAG